MTPPAADGLSPADLRFLRRCEREGGVVETRTRGARAALARDLRWRGYLEIADTHHGYPGGAITTWVVTDKVRAALAQREPQPGDSHSAARRER